MTKELRRCPFCGGEPTLSKRKSYMTWYRVICLNSMCVICPSTAEFEDKESAIKAWNRRKPEDRIVEQLEECSVNYCKEYGYAEDENVLYLPDAIKIVKSGGAV